MPDGAPILRANSVPPGRPPLGVHRLILQAVTEARRRRLERYVDSVGKEFIGRL